MVEHLPEWIMIRYSKLWNKFGEKEFTKDQAEKVITKDNSLAVCLSDLKKAGWLEMKMHLQDARKTIYKLKNPKDAIMEEIKGMNKRW